MPDDSTPGYEPPNQHLVELLARARREGELSDDLMDDIDEALGLDEEPATMPLFADSEAAAETHAP